MTSAGDGAAGHDGLAGQVVTDLIGVYNADGSLTGEVRYLFGRLRGTVHCGLCDITHGPLRRKSEWDAYVASLPVRFVVVHRDERSPEVAEASGQETPCVLGRTASGLVVVMDSAELDAASGRVSDFGLLLDAALARRSLVLG